MSKRRLDDGGVWPAVPTPEPEIRWGEVALGVGIAALLAGLALWVWLARGGGP